MDDVAAAAVLPRIRIAPRQPEQHASAFAPWPPQLRPAPQLSLLSLFARQHQEARPPRKRRASDMLGPAQRKAPQPPRPSQRQRAAQAALPGMQQIQAAAGTYPAAAAPAGALVAHSAATDALLAVAELVATAAGLAGRGKELEHLGALIAALQHRLEGGESGWVVMVVGGRALGQRARAEQEQHGRHGLVRPP